MSQAHYEYPPTRNTWVGYQATNKDQQQQHATTTIVQTTNKMQDLSHVATQAEWRQYAGEPFFSQVGEYGVHNALFSKSSGLSFDEVDFIEQ